MIFICVLIMLPYLIACLATYFLARWFTASARAWALRHGIVSHVTHRSSHSIPTARLGGVGMVIAFLLVSAVYTVVYFQNYGEYFFKLLGLPLDGPDGEVVYRSPLQLSAILWVAGGLLLSFTVGLLDDVFDLPSLPKLGLSIIAVAIPTFGGYMTFPAFDAWGAPHWATYMLNAGLSAFWLLFFINAYNFMDGMDGFAAGFARIASFFFFLLFLCYPFNTTSDPGPHADFMFFLPFLLCACWGFLYWNNPPAKVFMGDGGSLSIGYLLAIYVIIGARLNPPAAIPALSMLTILLPFIFDVVLTLIRRSLRGENILKAHREHLYQRLMKTGLSHGEVLRLTKKRFWACGVAAILGALPAHPAGRWAAFAFALGVMGHYWRLTLARERALSVQSVENK